MSAPKMTIALGALREASASLTALWLAAAEDITPEDIKKPAIDRWTLLKERIGPIGYVSISEGNEMSLSCDESVEGGVSNYAKTFFPEYHISVGKYWNEGSDHYSSRIFIMGVDEKHPAGIKHYGTF